MIRPEDAISTQPAGCDRERMDALEADVDAAIRLSRQIGHWPAIVTATRDGITPEEVDAVLRRYANEGWAIAPGGPGVIAYFERPTLMQRIADLGDMPLPEGAAERAVERAKREGVL